MVYRQGNCDETKYWLKLTEALDIAQAEQIDNLIRWIPTAWKDRLQYPLKTFAVSCQLSET